jgi:glycosyltransferase involved in cell wall biosynthesis
MKIKFSIITPTYNRLDSGYLARCINSILDQKSGNFTAEHIVVNDGSSDGTADYLKKISLDHKGLITVNQKNSGVVGAWRRGLSESSGDYVIFLDDDDELTPDSLYLRAEYIRENPALDWFYAKALWIDGSSKRIKNWFQSTPDLINLYERMLVRNLVHSGTTVVKRDAFNEIIWPNWLNRSQDYFVSLELLRPERSLNVGFLNEYVARYRWHDAMYTKKVMAKNRLYREKEDLNDKIRKLHDPGLAYLAKELYEADKKIVDLLRIKERLNGLEIESAELKTQLDKIINSRSWKLASFFANIYNFTTEKKWIKGHKKQND